MASGSQHSTIATISERMACSIFPAEELRHIHERRRLDLDCMPPLSGGAGSGSLSPDSCCAGRMAVTAELGHNQTHAPRQKTYSITVGAAYFGADWSFLRIFAGWRWTAPRLLNGRNSVFSERNQLANLTRVLRFGGRLVTSSAPGIGEREEQKRVGSDRRRNSLSERGGSRSCGLRPQ